MWTLTDLMSKCRFGADGFGMADEKVVQCQNPVVYLNLAAEGDPHAEDNIYGYWITGGAVCEEHRNMEFGGVDCPTLSLPVEEIFKLIATVAVRR